MKIKTLRWRPLKIKTKKHGGRLVREPAYVSVTVELKGGRLWKNMVSKAEARKFVRMVKKNQKEIENLIPKASLLQVEAEKAGRKAGLMASKIFKLSGCGAYQKVSNE